MGHQVIRIGSVGVGGIWTGVTNPASAEALTWS